MERAPSSIEGDHPPLEEHSRAIDCPVSVLQNLRASVLDRFNSTPHGGGDLTGVLFGTRNGDAVRISAFCIGESQGDLQQSEALTETQRAITAVIAAARDQKELAGLEPLGWFRAHPRCNLGLDERDIEIANTLFPQFWQVALVMRPGNSAASRVCFYFREREGPWTADCAVREFTVPAVELEPAREDAPNPAEAEDKALAQVELSPRMSALLAPPERRRAMRLPVIGVVGLAIAALAGGIYYYEYMRPEPLGLNVRMTESAAQIRIAWDRTAGPVRNAKAGYLEIGDGGQEERVDLNAEELQIGYINHPRQSNQVRVRLVVLGDGGAPAEEVTQFVAPPGSAPPAPVAEPGQAPSEVADGPPEKTPELDVPVPVDTGETAEERAKVQPPAKFQPPVAQPARTVPLEQAPAPEVGAPAQVARNAPTAVVTAPIPRTEPPPEKPAPPPQRPAPASSTAAATAPGQLIVRPPVAARPPATAPSSGRVIWIGRLQKNQPVTINGRSSSTGTLIGELPARPFKFSISPGDLSSDGIVLYSANMQYANSVVEPPGAQNGWNKTVYTWNPKFANDVSIDEGPAAQNGWNRMVLHSKNPKISVIVIDWTAVN